MYGWRARIGHLNPSPATVGLEEWRATAPDGVSFVGSRYMVYEYTREGVARMLLDLERAAREVASAGVAVIVQCSAIGGLEDEAEVRRRIESATGITAITVLGSMVAALRALRSERILLVSPYTLSLSDDLRGYLGTQGFEIVAARCLELRRSFEFGNVAPHEAYRLGKQLAQAHPEADTILFSGGNLRTLETLDPLAWDTGMKVLSSNMAARWRSLGAAGVGEPIRHGSLARVSPRHVAVGGRH